MEQTFTKSFLFIRRVSVWLCHMLMFFREAVIVLLLQNTLALWGGGGGRWKRGV